MRTTAQYVKLGTTYNESQDRSEGVTNITTIMSWFSTGEPELPWLQPGLFDVLPILVDCDHEGTEASATTTHTAGYFPVSTGYTNITKVTTGTDQGMCPHVPPVAHFNYSADGFSATDQTVLELTEPTFQATISLSADRTEHDAPIVEYDWYVNGELIGSGYYASFQMTTSNVGIRLVVTDALGNTSFADGGIVIQTPPSPPDGGGGGGSGGGGGVCYEIWLVWPDGYEVQIGEICFLAKT